MTLPKQPLPNHKTSLATATGLGICLMFSTLPAFGDPSDNPRISFDQILEGYQGSFKVVHDSGGYRSTAWSSGRMGYNPDRGSVFISSADNDSNGDMVGEFLIPETLSSSTNPNQLPNASLLQDFVRLQDRVPFDNVDNLNEVGGITYSNGELIVQYADWYDAAGDNRQTTLVVKNANRLSNSQIDGFFEMDGAARTFNYVSPIPAEWQSVLGGDFFAGNGNDLSISSRLSIGPSMFVFDRSDLSGSRGGRVPTDAKMTFDLGTALGIDLYPWNGSWDQYNRRGINSGFTEKNDLWTVQSAAVYGFIVPGTRTFVVVGRSGMHNSGGGYKIVQNNGNLCGGPCPYDPADNYPYYWLFDLNDIVNASAPWDVTPYEYGSWDDRFPMGLPSAGSFDPSSGKLLIVVDGATANDDGGHPVINVYQIGDTPPPVEEDSPPNAPEIRGVTIISDS